MIKNIKFSEDQIFSVYKLSYSISESTGKEKKNIINTIIIESLKNTNKYKDCVFKPEVRLKPLWGKFFPVDVAIYKNDELIEIILAKAPASNIKQNKVNSMNAINSEIDRISHYNVKISLINFLPNISPYFSRNEDLKKFENNKPDFLMKSGIVKGVNVDEIFITFDVDGITGCKTKKEVKVIFKTYNPIKNIKIEEFNYFKQP